MVVQSALHVFKLTAQPIDQSSPIVLDKTSANFDVVVVGLGPTGATLANLLGLCGLSVLIIEREAGIYSLPRAVHFDDEIMRVWQNIGIVGALSSQLFINKGMRFCNYQGEILLDWPRPQSLTDNGWNASYRFHQPDLESELRAALQRFPKIQCKTQCNFEHLEQSEIHNSESVRVTYTDLQTNQLQAVTARYVVGCDGARSAVRRCLNVSMQTLGFEQRWLVVDTQLTHEMPALGDHTIQYCDPVRPATYCRNPGNRRRWEFALSDNESDEQMSDPESVWSLLRHWISPDDAHLERYAVYTFKSEVAQQWRRGRVFLAGDAAHLTPPFMGQGMCAGIRDAANLAWKLSLAGQSEFATSLLDSYQSERKPNVIAYIEKAVELGELINRIGVTSERRDSLAGDSRIMKSIDSRLGSGLGDDSDACRGRQFPQFRLRGGELLDEQVGYRYLLLTNDAGKRDAPLVAPAVDAYTILTQDEPAAKAVLNTFATDSILVRPDRYIMATGKRCYAD